MPRLPERGRRALEQVRLIASDASSIGLLARRTLEAIDSAVPFDDGALFGVDPSTLVLNRLLAYRGTAPDALRDWVRDVYLVAREPGAMHFPTLLASGGGAAAYHEDTERWLRVPPPPVPSRALRDGWRLWDSPPGGVVRYGLAHRRRWVAALQLSRLEPGSGFRPGELEILDRAAPTLARALVAQLASPGTPAAGERPRAGQLVFDGDRRLVSMSASAEAWLARLADADAPAATPGGQPSIPVAVQALVSHLAGSAQSSGRITASDVDGRRVAVLAERAVRLDPERSEELSGGYAVSLSSAPLDAGGSDLTGAQWAVAQAVARGLSDREIAASLQVSPATVHEHVGALHRLLGTSTRARLVAELAVFGREPSP
jgi:DNA-binding CsgD family transcriptional regulator